MNSGMEEAGSIAGELAQSELFRDAPPAMLRRVLEHAVPLELPAGEVLLAPDRENQHVYVLLSGGLAVHFGSLDSPEIRALGKGISVGEMSVIDGATPSAYVVAKEASRVFPVHRDLLLELISDAYPVAGNLLRLLTRWIKANTQRIINDREQIWELTDHANIDALTGLYNRRWLDGVLPRLQEQASKGGHPLCIMLIDVDHFKQYNDRHGHLGGDQALAALANAMKTTVRPYDFIVRYGGEEFMVMLPNTGMEEGVAIAERIREAAERKNVASADGAVLPGITVSIGLAANRADFTPRSLIAAADVQLYRAKEEGRNRVCS